MNCPHGRNPDACESCRCPYDVKGCHDAGSVCIRCRMDLTPNARVNAVDDAVDLAWSIARCDHRRAIVLSGSDKEWCRDCGAVHAVGVAGWLEPTAWQRAKEVDARMPSWGRISAPVARDSGAKKRN